MTEMILSPRKSFKGYSFKEALVRNKQWVKGIVLTISGIDFYTGFSWKKTLALLGAGIATLIIKMIIDAIDFWYSEIEIPKE